MIVAWMIAAWVVQVQAADRLVNAKHATVDLIAYGEAPGAARELSIGIRFRLEPGWHVYWRNPGDSGQPPSVRWLLPPGVRAGEFEWPLPERIPVDSLINYGYKNSVVLPARLALAPGVPTAPLRIGAALRWLICHDVCIPDKADLELSLPLSDPDRKQLPGWRREMEDARSRVPRPLPETWMAAAASRGDSFVVSLSMDRPVAATPVLYPIDAGQIDDSAPQEIKISGGALTLTLRKSDQLPAEPEVFRFVLALSSGEAFAAAVPVQKQNGDHSKEKKKK